MSQPHRLADALAPLRRWLDARLNDAAEGLVGLAERLRPRRRVHFVEQEDGAFAGPAGICRIEQGACVFSGPLPDLRRLEVEFRLSADRCTFRELELPAGAAPFLDGVVRAQIDRLTPWRAQEAAFGFVATGAKAPDRIGVLIAATRRSAVAPLLDLRSHAVVVTAQRAGAPAPVVIEARRAGDAARRAAVRATLATALAVALVAALAAQIADLTYGAAWRERIDAGAAELAQLRAALARRAQTRSDPAAQALDARKRAAPAAVVALEGLSRALPDTAYLTEFRLSGEKLEMSGVAADAAALIRALEQSPHFSRAAFSAPTMHGQDERQNFRIEAHVAPLNRIAP